MGDRVSQTEYKTNSCVWYLFKFNYYVVSILPKLFAMTHVHHKKKTRLLLSNMTVQNTLHEKVISA